MFEIGSKFGSKYDDRYTEMMQHETAGAMTPAKFENGAPDVQLLFVGSNHDLAREMVASLGANAHEPVLLEYHQRENVEWQSLRAPGSCLAVVMHRGRAAIQETIAWIQVISLAFRPIRLLVVLPHFDLSHVLQLSRAGADGVLTGEPTAEEIIRELERDGVRGGDYFPDPNQWLKSLRQANEELLFARDPATQLNKLLRRFASQLKMNRASILLRESGAMKLAAGFALPDDMIIGATIEPRPDSITAWVLENKCARLVEGRYGQSAVRSAICVPMMFHEELIGIVNFSSLKTGRVLTPADLAAAEVFASLLAMAISNYRLHSEKIAAERLATIGKTTATISHCIKNILQIFKGSAMMLAQGQKTGDPGTGEQGVLMLGRATARLEGLVRDLLDFSKARQPHLAPVSPAALLNEVISVYDTSISSKHRIEQHCEIIGEIMLDSDRLQRALINLISNSMDVMPHGGRILLNASREEDKAVFTVSDEGPGVADKQMELIFDPFFSTKGSKGTGLGLATVKKFCEENGGFVCATRSETLGGLCVRIELPYLPGN